MKYPSQKVRRGVACPRCPRCNSNATEPVRNFGRAVKGRFECLSCKRWFGPNNPLDSGGTGERPPQLVTEPGCQGRHCADGTCDVCKAVPDGDWIAWKTVAHAPKRLGR